MTPETVFMHYVLVNSARCLFNYSVQLRRGTVLVATARSVKYLMSYSAIHGISVISAPLYKLCFLYHVKL